MKQYVTCIVFDEEMEKTVLIIKNGKLPFLEGKLMNPGGSIEPCETLNEAASREFNEECGVDIPDSNWSYIGTLILNQDNTEIAHCHYVKAVIPRSDILTARQMEAEPVIITDISTLGLNDIDADVMSMFVLAYSRGCTVGSATVTRYL
jgi:ADP-ribose pyrophosphatase YjhB (NUDIX family)